MLARVLPELLQRKERASNAALSIAPGRQRTRRCMTSAPLFFDADELYKFRSLAFRFMLALQELSIDVCCRSRNQL